MFAVLFIVVVGLVFEFINGFHDTANAIATSVATKVLTPRQAVTLAATLNLVGALVGTAVATTIGQGLIDTRFATPGTIVAALASGIVWNLITWRLGLPSSSSHALIGGLCGATVAAAHGDWSVVRWSALNPVTHAAEGLWPKVVLPMIASPTIGFLLAFGVMVLLLWAFHRRRPEKLKRTFSRCQIASAAWMSFSHGTNDAQKTMGIIALTLYVATTRSHAFDDLPPWLDFLRAPEFKVYPWIKIICAITIGAGTAVGGWRIIQTVGRKLVRLQPIHGFAAQSSAAAIIHLASHWGIPLSTTHVITASVLGVGATRGLRAVRWTVAERMIWAWVMTLPVTLALGYLFGLASRHWF